MKKTLNQKLINLIEYYNLINANLLISNAPLNRTIISKTNNFNSTKLQKLENLKNQINKIKNCLLKKSAKKIVFGDGNIERRYQ